MGLLGGGKNRGRQGRYTIQIHLNEIIVAFILGTIFGLLLMPTLSFIEETVLGTNRFDSMRALIEKIPHLIGKITQGVIDIIKNYD